MTEWFEKTLLGEGEALCDACSGAFSYDEVVEVRDLTSWIVWHYCRRCLDGDQWGSRW